MNQTVLQYNNFGFTSLVESDLSFLKFYHQKRLLLLQIRTLVRQAQQRLLFTSVGYMFQPIHRSSSGLRFFVLIDVSSFTS